MIKVKLFLCTFFTLLVGFSIFNLAVANGKLLPSPVIGEDGLYQQKWFHESFLDLKEDLIEAKSGNKRFVVFWEQKGCPYCKRTHEVNLRIPRIVKTIMLTGSMIFYISYVLLSTHVASQNIKISK